MQRGSTSRQRIIIITLAEFLAERLTARQSNDSPAQFSVSNPIHSLSSPRSPELAIRTSNSLYFHAWRGQPSQASRPGGPSRCPGDQVGKKGPRDETISD